MSLCQPGAIHTLPQKITFWVYLSACCLLVIVHPSDWSEWLEILWCFTFGRMSHTLKLRFVWVNGQSRVKSAHPASSAASGLRFTNFFSVPFCSVCSFLGFGLRKKADRSKNYVDYITCCRGLFQLRGGCSQFLAGWARSSAHHTMPGLGLRAGVETDDILWSLFGVWIWGNVGFSGDPKDASSPLLIHSHQVDVD